MQTYVLEYKIYEKLTYYICILSLVYDRINRDNFETNGGIFYDKP